MIAVYKNIYIIYNYIICPAGMLETPMSTVYLIQNSVCVCGMCGCFVLNCLPPNTSSSNQLQQIQIRYYIVFHSFWVLMLRLTQIATLIFVAHEILISRTLHYVLLARQCHNSCCTPLKGVTATPSACCTLWLVKWKLRRHSLCHTCHPLYITD